MKSTIDGMPCTEPEEGWLGIPNFTPDWSPLTAANLSSLGLLQWAMLQQAAEPFQYEAKAE